MNKVALGLLVAIGFVVPAPAQDWAEKMFEIKKHDFGSVARGAHTEFKFPVKNLYKEDIHIAEVRRSCGCTTPIIEKEWLKTGEVGHIIAHFNTDTFKGQKGATLTVVIDKPYRAEVQLRVDGYIRTDVVFNPNRVEFGAVMEGESATRLVNLAYAGRSDWAIERVESNHPHIHATAEETGRQGGRVSYQIRVELDPSAEPGMIQDALTLVTNDTRMSRVPLEVTGDVIPALSVSPKALALGDIKPGDQIEKRLVVRAPRPFRLQGIKLAGFDIEYQPTDEAKTTHIVDVRMTAQESQNVQQDLMVETDLPGKPRGSVLVTANVGTE